MKYAVPYDIPREFTRIALDGKQFHSNYAEILVWCKSNCTEEEYYVPTRIKAIYDYEHYHDIAAYFRDRNKAMMFKLKWS